MRRFANGFWIGLTLLVFFYGYRLGQLERSHDALDRVTAQAIREFASRLKACEESNSSSVKIEGDLLDICRNWREIHQMTRDIQEQQTEAIIDAEVFVQGFADYLGYPPACGCSNETTFAGDSR